MTFKDIGTKDIFQVCCSFRPLDSSEIDQLEQQLEVASSVKVPPNWTRMSSTKVSAVSVHLSVPR